MKHIVCYSGGHSSAVVAVEVVRRFGKESVVLLNHDINGRYESPDIKRFKNQVAEYLGLPITYANHEPVDGEIPSQFDVCIVAKSFVNPATRSALCTNRLKTAPFMAYLKSNHEPGECVIYYGFDANETHRIQRRSSIMGLDGWQTDYPLALWPERTIQETEEIGIKRPCTYSAFKHANCIGCLKAKKQHWYCVYVLRPDIWQEAKDAEETIGHSVLPKIYLDELEKDFKKMKAYGVLANEHTPFGEFWRDARASVGGQMALDFAGDARPCECSF